MKRWSWLMCALAAACGGGAKQTTRTPKTEPVQAAIALAGPQHPLVGILRYKLAWTSYRMDAFADAFDAFWLLVDDPAAADFRRESLQYVAITIMEPSWDGDPLADPVTGLDRPEVKRRLAGKEPWIHELLAEVAAIHVLVADTAGAARVYDLAAARAPDPATAKSYQGKADDARRR